MNQNDYIDLVTHLFSTNNGRKLLEHLTKIFSEKIYNFEILWNNTDVNIKKDDRALYAEIGKYNLIQAFQYIIDNPDKVKSVDISKLNEDLNNE